MPIWDFAVVFKPGPLKGEPNAYTPQTTDHYTYGVRRFEIGGDVYPKKSLVGTDYFKTAAADLMAEGYEPFSAAGAHESLVQGGYDLIVDQIWFRRQAVTTLIGRIRQALRAIFRDPRQ